MALIFQDIDRNSFKGQGDGREGSGILRCQFSVNRWILAPFSKIQQLFRERGRDHELLFGHESKENDI